MDLEIQINNSLCYQMNRLHLYTTVKTPVSKGYFSIKQYSPYLKEGQRFGVRSGCGCGEERLRMVTAASLSWRFASVCAYAPDVVSKGFIQGCKGVRQTFTNSFNGRITWRKNIRLPYHTLANIRHSMRYDGLTLLQASKNRSLILFINLIGSATEKLQLFLFCKKNSWLN